MDVLSASVNDDKIAWYENDGAPELHARSTIIAPPPTGPGRSSRRTWTATATWTCSRRPYNDDKIAWYEQANVADPLDPDSDDDGLLDGAEVNTHATDPLDADSDDDGLLDGFEVANGFDPLTPGEQSQDPDGDGLTNLAEQAAGSNPNVAPTPLAWAAVSPDVTVTLGGVVVDPEDVAVDNLLGVVLPVDLGSLPTGVNVTAYHLFANGDQLFSLDAAAVLPGPLTAEPEDVVRWDGVSYTLEFDGSAEGVPGGVAVDAVSGLGDDLLLSFDAPVTLGASPPPTRIWCASTGSTSRSSSTAPPPACRRRSTSTRRTTSVASFSCRSTEAAACPA